MEGEEGEEGEDGGDEEQETTCSAKDEAFADGAKAWRHTGQERGVESIMTERE